MNVDPATGLESMAFHIGWAPGPADCSGFHLHHYELHRVGDPADSSFSGNPAYIDRANNLVATYSPSTHAADNFTHYPLGWARYRIYACIDDTCSHFFGDGAFAGDTVSNYTDADVTQVEAWELQGITDTNDLGHVILNDPDCLAPHAFAYPTDWDAGTFKDKVALYYSCSPMGDPSQIWYMLSQNTSWPAGGLNTDGDWDTPIQVGRGSTSQADADYGATHPWAMITRDGGTKGITLFAQSDEGSSDADGYHDQVVWVASEDVDGTDYGGACTDTGCLNTLLDGANAGVALAADGTSGTDYADDIRHSRVLWDYVINPYLDVGVDEPFMLFQLDHSASDQCVDVGDQWDDIGYADCGAWSGGACEWTIEMDGGTPYSCPVEEISDGHDVTGVPLPYGEFRIYYKDADTGDFHLKIWTGTDWASWYNGSAWVQESPVEFYWDGMASGGPDDQCIDNFAAILYSRGGTIHEGAFFTVEDSDKCNGSVFGPGLTGLDAASDPGGGNDTSQNSLVFALHAN